jgi:hypothetical protein
MNPDLKPECHNRLFLFKKFKKLARSGSCRINKGHIQDIKSAYCSYGFRSEIRCLFDPGSGIVFSDPDLGSGSQTHIFDSFMTNFSFWVKNTVILNDIAKKKSFTCSKIKLFTIV